MKVPIGEIQIKEGRRSLDAVHVRELADSIRELGLLNPVTIDKENVLIAGLHRLEAARALGWAEVECTVSSLDGLQAELAEIDENFVRSGLDAVEYSEMLLRRKEIYEMLYPETKATYEGGQFRGNQHRDVVPDKMSPTTKSFVRDTADRLGVAPRTVERQIRTAKKLTPEAKDISSGTRTRSCLKRRRWNCRVWSRGIRRKPPSCLRQRKSGQWRNIWQKGKAGSRQERKPGGDHCRTERPR